MRLKELTLLVLKNIAFKYFRGWISTIIPTSVGNETDKTSQHEVQQ